MCSYVLKNWPATITHFRTSSQLVLAMKSMSRVGEYGLLKLGFGNSNLPFIYLGPTFKAIVISSPQAFKLIFEAILKSPLHLRNIHLVLSSEAEIHTAFSHTALCTDVICSPSSLPAASSNSTGLVSYYYHTGNRWATNDIFLTLSISND